MQESLFTQIFIQVIGILFTLGTMVYITGKRSGIEDITKANILLRLDQIDERLTSIEEKSHMLEITVAELKIIVIGVDAQNGIRGVIRSIDERLRLLERNRAA